MQLQMRSTRAAFQNRQTGYSDMRLAKHGCMNANRQVVESNEAVVIIYFTLAIQNGAAHQHGQAAGAEHSTGERR